MGALSAGRSRFASALAATVLTVLLLLLFGRTAELFLLLFIAVLFSLYLGAVADAIQRCTAVPRRWAVLLAVLLTLVLIAGFIWIFVPPVVSQTQALLKVLPQYIINTESAIDQVIARNPALRSVWHPGEHRVILAVYDQVSRYFADVVPNLFS
ncbi:MAG TPA: AI-2E family transporter, partial [Gemmatimonadaceae bacterium]